MIDKKRQEKEKLPPKAHPLQTLKEELRQCQQLKNEYLAGWQRAKADYQNLEKSVSQQTAKDLFELKEKYLLEKLEKFEQLEIAAKYFPEDLKGNSCFQGIVQISKQYKQELEKEGLEEMASLGQKFDPEVHEAVGIVESDKEGGLVVEVLKKGYKIEGRILRPSKVKVSK